MSNHSSSRSLCPTLAVALVFLCASTRAAAQVPDNPETLAWVKQHGLRIDSSLQEAMHTQDPYFITLRMLEAFVEFDAVAMAGIYCTDARAAAEWGRRQCDIVNFRLEKDPNSLTVRVLEARNQARLMAASAANCLTQSERPGSDATASFRPVDVIRTDAETVSLMLEDGMASADFHILSQKIEQAIRLLHDVEHLAEQLPGCRATLRAASEAVEYCTAALTARNWTEVNKALRIALVQVASIKNNPCR